MPTVGKLKLKKDEPSFHEIILGEQLANAFDNKITIHHMYNGSLEIHNNDTGDKFCVTYEELVQWAFRRGLPEPKVKGAKRGKRRTS